MLSAGHSTSCLDEHDASEVSGDVDALAEADDTQSDDVDEQGSSDNGEYNVHVEIHVRNGDSKNKKKTKSVRQGLKELQVAKETLPVQNKTQELHEKAKKLLVQLVKTLKNKTKYQKKVNQKESETHKMEQDDFMQFNDAQSEKNDDNNKNADTFNENIQKENVTNEKADDDTKKYAAEESGNQIEQNDSSQKMRSGKKNREKLKNENYENFKMQSENHYHEKTAQTTTPSPATTTTEATTTTTTTSSTTTSTSTTTTTATTAKNTPVREISINLGNAKSKNKFEDKTLQIIIKDKTESGDGFQLPSKSEQKAPEKVDKGVEESTKSTEKAADQSSKKYKKDNEDTGKAIKDFSHSEAGSGDDVSGDEEEGDGEVDGDGDADEDEDGSGDDSDEEEQDGSDNDTTSSNINHNIASTITGKTLTIDFQENTNLLGSDSQIKNEPPLPNISEKKNEVGESEAVKEKVKLTDGNSGKLLHDKTVIQRLFNDSLFEQAATKENFDLDVNKNIENSHQASVDNNEENVKKTTSREQNDLYVDTNARKRNEIETKETYKQRRNDLELTVGGNPNVRDDYVSLLLKKGKIAKAPSNIFTNIKGSVRMMKKLKEVTSKNKNRRHLKTEASGARKGIKTGKKTKGIDKHSFHPKTFFKHLKKTERPVVGDKRLNIPFDGEYQNFDSNLDSTEALYKSATDPNAFTVPQYGDNNDQWSESEVEEMSSMMGEKLSAPKTEVVPPNLENMEIPKEDNIPINEQREVLQQLKGFVAENPQEDIGLQKGNFIEEITGQHIGMQTGNIPNENYALPDNAPNIVNAPQSAPAPDLNPTEEFKPYQDAETKERILAHKKKAYDHAFQNEIKQAEIKYEEMEKKQEDEEMKLRNERYEGMKQSAGEQRSHQASKHLKGRKILTPAHQDVIVKLTKRRKDSNKINEDDLELSRRNILAGRYENSTKRKVIAEEQKDRPQDIGKKGARLTESINEQIQEKVEKEMSDAEGMLNNVKRRTASRSNRVVVNDDGDLNTSKRHHIS